MAYSFVNQQSDLARMRVAIDERGNIAQVFVSYREIPDVADDGGGFITADEFKFTGHGIGLSSYQLSPYLPASIVQQRFDHRQLVNFISQDCKPKSDPETYCTSNRPIKIAYLSPLTKDDFYLPDFRPRFYYSDIGNWFLFPLVTVLFCFLPGGPFVILTSALHSAFLGIDPQEALDEIS
jgi:hypothetical protein